MPPVIAAAAAGETLAGSAVAEAGAGIAEGAALTRAGALRANTAAQAVESRVPGQISRVRPPRLSGARRRQKTAPPPVMTWRKGSLYLIIAGIFDFLRAICEQSWLLAPMLISAYTSSTLSKLLGSTVAGVVGKIAGVSAAFFTTGALLLIGPIIGLAVGFLGFLTLLVLLLMLNGRIFKENADSLLWMGGGFLVAEMPLIGTIPSLSVAMWRLLHTQIKKERATFEKWKKEHAEAERQEREEILAQANAMRAYALTQEQKEVARAVVRENEREEIPEESLGPAPEDIYLAA